jgi:hypothetical protein
LSANIKANGFIASTGNDQHGKFLVAKEIMENKFLTRPNANYMKKLAL